MLDLKDNIVTQEEIDLSRKLAEKKYEKYTSDEIEHLRRLCKTDPMFLGAGILGYDELSPNLHGHYFRWLKEHKYDRFLMTLMPRAHFKTTCGYVDSVQTVLPILLEGERYPYNRGVDIRIAVGHETLDKAEEFMFEISGHFTSNHRLMGLFPELVPNARVQRINKSQLELPRNQNWSEPTFEAFGTGGKSQGRHFDILKLDDIYGTDARDSEAERKRIIQWFKGIQAFFVNPKSSQLRIAGTRYDLDDVYSVALEDYAEDLKCYIRKVQEDGVYIFPEHFDDEAVKVLKKDLKTWNSWYLNDPYEGKARFEIDWLAYYKKIEGRDMLSIPNGETTEYVEYDQLDRVLIFDPAMTGTFGVCVTGTDRNRIFVLEGFRGSLKPPEQIRMLFNLVLRYRPRVVAIEEVLFSALYKEILAYEMAQRKVYFNIVPVKPRKIGTGRLNKTERINVLSPYFSSKRIYVNPEHKDLIQEYKDYGASVDIHVLDALAYGPELWQFHDASRYAKYKKIENDMMKKRDPDTGYSSIY